MEIINHQQEYETITNFPNDTVYVGISGKSVSNMHIGHIHIYNEIRKLKPTAKIICRIYTDQPEVFGAANFYFPKYDPDTGALIQRQGPQTINPRPAFNIQNLYNWVELNTSIDYCIDINMSPSGLGPYINDYNKMSIAQSSLLYNLTFDDINNHIAEAEAIIEDGGFYQWNNFIDTNIIKAQLLACLNGQTHTIRGWCNKDVYYTKAKKYIYDMFGHESVIVEPLIDPNTGFPYSGRISKMDQIEKDKIKTDIDNFKTGKTAPTFTFSPKWMDGATFKQLTYVLPDGIQLPIVEVV